MTPVKFTARNGKTYDVHPDHIHRTDDLHRKADWLDSHMPEDVLGAGATLDCVDGHRWTPPCGCEFDRSTDRRDGELREVKFIHRSRPCKGHAYLAGYPEAHHAAVVAEHQAKNKGH